MINFDQTFHSNVLTRHISALEGHYSVILLIEMSDDTEVCPNAVVMVLMAWQSTQYKYYSSDAVASEVIFKVSHEGTSCHTTDLCYYIHQIMFYWWCPWFWLWFWEINFMTITYTKVLSQCSCNHQIKWLVLDSLMDLPLCWSIYRYIDNG